MKTLMLLLCVCFAAYSLAVYRCSAGISPAPRSADAEAGWQLWMEKNCQSCHQLYGLGGYMGPDLTNVASVKGADYMRGLIQYGTGRMPDFHLSDKETEQLIAFLTWVDQSGVSIVPDTAVQWTGTYFIPTR